MANILITGGAGFIGANFIEYGARRLLGRMIVLDALTYAGQASRLERDRADLTLIEGNICDRPLVDTLLSQYAVDTIVHFAAESHVDRSIAGPAPFIQTNLVGTFTLLEGFRRHWEAQGCPAHFRFLHISTDEVYGSLGPAEPSFTENSAYAPNSPYAAAKAGSDHLVRAYHHTYGLPTLITHSSNNYGPYQHPEKLIPLMAVNVLLGKPLPIYGDGQNIRDWLHVTDHCEALILVLRRGNPGETYNIGGVSEWRNLDLVEAICESMGSLVAHLPVKPAHKLITFVSDRPGHDRRYAIDISKIRQTLGWSPKIAFQDGLTQTLQWYIEHADWWCPLLPEVDQQCYSRLYGAASPGSSGN